MLQSHAHKEKKHTQQFPKSLRTDDFYEDKTSTNIVFATPGIKKLLQKARKRIGLFSVCLVTSHLAGN